MVNVLFICVHNAGRSQMSEAFFNKLAKCKHYGISAGSHPSEQVNPVVIEVMREVNLDLSGKKPKKLNADMALAADLAITMGCGDECPIVIGDVREWHIEDPHGKTIEKVREIRDTIRAKIEALVKELDEKPIEASN